uniref:Uncharacterized protein n=1 Tax=Anguilla anguilla TaxID=7936 RepID=A0A0E9SN66_ANGAN
MIHDNCAKYVSNKFLSATTAT